jgi:hypothetical protein
MPGACHECVLWLFSGLWPARSFREANDLLTGDRGGRSRPGSRHLKLNRRTVRRYLPDDVVVVVRHLPDDVVVVVRRKKPSRL